MSQKFYQKCFTYIAYTQLYQIQDLELIPRFIVDGKLSLRKYFKIGDNRMHFDILCLVESYHYDLF